MKSVKELSAELIDGLQTNSEFDSVPAIMGMAFFVTPHGLRYHFVKSDDSPLESAGAEAIRDDMKYAVEREAQRVEKALRILDDRSQKEFDEAAKIISRSKKVKNAEFADLVIDLLRDIAREERKRREDKEGA